MSKQDDEISQEANEEIEKSHSENKNSVSEEEIGEALNELPPQVRRVAMTMMQQTSMRGGVAHPLFDKFTEKHIDKFLDYSQKDDDNAFKLKSTNRWFYLLYTIIGMGFFVFLIIYLLPQEKELLVDILRLVVAFAGGLGSGYGLKSLRKD
jgi:hypothetical protein